MGNNFCICLDNLDDNDPTLFNNDFNETCTQVSVIDDSKVSEININTLHNDDGETNKKNLIKDDLTESKITESLNINNQDIDKEDTNNENIDKEVINNQDIDREDINRKYSPEKILKDNWIIIDKND